MLFLDIVFMKKIKNNLFLALLSVCKVCLVIFFVDKAIDYLIVTSTILTLLAPLSKTVHTEKFILFLISLLWMLFYLLQKRNGEGFVEGIVTIFYLFAFALAILNVKFKLFIEPPSLSFVRGLLRKRDKNTKNARPFKSD